MGGLFCSKVTAVVNSLVEPFGANKTAEKEGNVRSLRHTVIIGVVLLRAGESVQREAPRPSRGLARLSRCGFTLIEIMVVVVVIAVLATLVAPNVFQHVASARTTTARTQLEQLGVALDAYRLHIGHYPTSQAGLSALWEKPAGAPASWGGPYLRKAVPLDPWGNQYLYSSPGAVNRESYDLISLGADGRRGGTGEAADVVSW